jgi:ABC-type lipoprotein export system ATPase subunit/ABC-type lipoprotein release transport system permease subunit
MEDTAQSTKSELIVTSTNIWKSFPTGDHYTTILKDVSVDINKGEFVVLFGPSGCGKSTFLNTLMGLEHPDKGDIKFMGMDIWHLNSDDRAVIRKSNVGIIYQQQNWIKSLSVIENVSIVGSLLGMTKEEATRKAREKLNLVGMTHRTNYKPYELSSGEQQRISLARALMSDPALIVADEPTGSLDVKSGLKVMRILKDLAAQGKTVLMVTHNPEYFEFADRVLFMIDGKIRKDIIIKHSDVKEMRRRVAEDLDAFINDVQAGEIPPEGQNAPAPTKYKEEASSKQDKLRQFLDSLKFLSVFTFSMILMLTLFVPSYILEKLFFRKSKLSSKVSEFIIKLFNKLEGEDKGVQKSISSWDIGEISLSYLMVKRSRTLITVLGVGVGIGFITFLLSIGYGLENLVVNEIAEIEEMRQVIVDPVVGGEVRIDSERYELIGNKSGVREQYPLINVAATVYYGDSQTDLVSHGVDSEYLSIARETFLQGDTFDSKQKEIVITSDVLTMLGIEEKEIIGEYLEVQFIPVDIETEPLPADEDVGGAYDDNIRYKVVGVISGGSTPVIYFPLQDALDLGIESYSELLVILEDNADMASVRREIEALGMKTNSVMDTVNQIEQFFSYLRLGLAVVGGIAFVIAILGMINTLTVSLMERTREVGLLKSIGMRSGEVRKLFITESMLISFFGGVSGILMGALMGAVISVILSGIAVTRGGEYLMVSKIPLLLIAGVIFVSVFIGYLTGLYPSRRAVKMSPLDALRYE